MAKQDDYVRYTIRLPKGVYAAIENAADAGNRSVNAEIVERLTFTIGNTPELLRNLHHRIAQLEEEVEVFDETMEVFNTRMGQVQKSNKELRSMNLDLKQKSDAWKELWEAQVTSKREIIALLISVCHQIISYGASAPSGLLIFAESMLEMFKTDASKSPEGIQGDNLDGKNERS